MKKEERKDPFKYQGPERRSGTDRRRLIDRRRGDRRKKERRDWSPRQEKFLSKFLPDFEWES